MKTYHIYMIAILIWNSLIYITPILASMDVEIADFLYFFFSFFCHQIPSRSLFLLGHQFPVCARDMGVYWGMLIGGIFLPFLMKSETKRIPPISIFVLLILPLAIDGTTQLLGWRESTNEIRIVTGLIAGVAIPFYLIPTVNKLLVKK